MEVFAMNDVSGARAVTDPAQQGWRGPSQDWLSRRLAVFALKVRERATGRRPGRRPQAGPK